MSDVAYCRCFGEVSSGAEWDDDYADWKYKIEGTDIEYVPLVVVIAFLSRARVLVVTVF